MPAPTNLKRKPAAATDHGGLRFVLTTARPIQKDQTHVYYHNAPRNYKPHR